MKTLEEIKAIAKEYNSGPIVHVALEDAIRWIEAYRQGWMEEEVESAHYGGASNYDLKDAAEEVDAEARRLLEKK